jgi:hypothetical protein
MPSTVGPAVFRHLHQFVGVHRSIKHGLAYPRKISRVQMFRGPRVSACVHCYQVCTSTGEVLPCR